MHRTLSRAHAYGTQNQHLIATYGKQFFTRGEPRLGKLIIIDRKLCPRNKKQAAVRQLNPGKNVWRSENCMRSEFLLMAKGAVSSATAADHAA
jgi:hypothetical protein